MALTIVAVTGTNGKTSVSQFIAQSLEALSLPCGVMGTLGVGRINALQHNGMTTPDPVSVQRLLAEFCQQGLKYAVIEASSHALSQGRLNSVDIDVAIFTNLSRDHLDYHKTMADYGEAKAQLFNIETVTTAVINAADDFGQNLMHRLADKSTLKLVSYSRKPLEHTVDFLAEDIKLTSMGLDFELVSRANTDSINTQLFGEFNIDNLLATAACLNALGLTQADIVAVLNKCVAVDGRMDLLTADNQASVVIDFAHTPDALMQALQSLRAHLSDEGQLLCVFGCGGNRDKGKRPLMGAAVEKYADVFVITDDNPRYETPADIVNDIISGLEQQEVAIEHDRKLAITSVIKKAKKGDIVLIAGKGHEQYQEVAGIKHPFSDKHIAHAALVAANDADISMTEANV